MTPIKRNLKLDAAKTAALLREDGWCQGDYRSDGARCIYGAIHDAVYPRGSVATAEDSPLAHELERRLDPDDQYVNLVFYNDSVIDSVEPLLEVLDAIAGGN